MINLPLLQVRTALQPSLSPRLQKAVRLLQLSSADYAQSLREAADANPFLEADELGGSGQPDAPPAGADAEVEIDEPELTAWAGEPGSRARPQRGDGAGEGFDTLAAQTRLADHLASQLHVLPLSMRDMALACAVVEALDEDGYLRIGLDEIGALLPLEPAPEPDELSIALKRVQALDPPGVGARELGECLCLQLSAIAQPRVQALAGVLLRGHLQALAARDFALLSRRLGVPREEIEAACRAIRRLDPHPGWRFGQPPAPSIAPDVIVKRGVRGQWRVSLNPEVLPRVHLNQEYARIYAGIRGAGHAQLGEQLQEARWTLRNIEQRCSTILLVARAIVARQHRFLALGAMAMRPLALREIAQEVGVHESTVSRVTSNKYMATPAGVFELKYFFSRAMHTDSGADCSPTAIRGLLRELIATEPAGSPLSDVDLARELAQQGLPVARRTVTKYRQQLRIAPAGRRQPFVQDRPAVAG